MTTKTIVSKNFNYVNKKLYEYRQLGWFTTYDSFVNNDGDEIHVGLAVDANYNMNKTVEAMDAYHNSKAW